MVYTNARNSTSNIIISDVHCPIQRVPNVHNLNIRAKAKPNKWLKARGTNKSWWLVTLRRSWNEMMATTTKPELRRISLWDACPWNLAPISNACRVLESFAGTLDSLKSLATPTWRSVWAGGTCVERLDFLGSLLPLVLLLLGLLSLLRLLEGSELPAKALRRFWHF